MSIKKWGGEMLVDCSIPSRVAGHLLQMAVRLLRKERFQYRDIIRASYMLILVLHLIPGASEVGCVKRRAQKTDIDRVLKGPERRVEGEQILRRRVQYPGMFAVTMLAPRNFHPRFRRVA